MNKDLAMKWVVALRSGKYKQGVGFLKDNNDRHCCLGVLADLCGIYLETHHELLEGAKFETCGLKTINGSFRIDYHTSFGSHGNLAGANDAGKSFEEIADWIEENYEQL